MKKSNKNYEIQQDAPLSMVNEYQALYKVPVKSQKKDTLIKDFIYDDFKKIVDKSPFTLADWADLLFISERTLHRYAKDKTGFNGLQIERILHLEHLINIGTSLFGKDGFKQWLQVRPFSLNGVAVKDSLSTHDDIQNVINIIERMQYGIPA